MKKYYHFLRTIHLYLGLLIRPFILIFAISILVFNHPGYFDKPETSENVKSLFTRLDSIPNRGTDLLTAKAIIGKLGIKGEIDFISKNDSILNIPVRTPRIVTQVRVNIVNGYVSIIRKEVGPLNATTFLHAMPGPHNASMRGNSGYIAAWRYIVDFFVYSLILLAFSGIILWYFISVYLLFPVY